MIRLVQISLLFLMIVLGCTMQITSKKVIKNDIEMLYGPVSISQLYFDYPEWQKIEQDYKPNAEIIDKLSRHETSYDVKIFLATWCSDSQREVPHFMKIIDEANLKNKLNVQMWAVDHKLKLDSNLAEKHQIDLAVRQ